LQLPISLSLSLSTSSLRPTTNNYKTISPLLFKIPPPISNALGQGAM